MTIETMHSKRKLMLAITVVWAMVTIALAVVGLLRLGNLSGRVTQVEHHTETIIHDEIHRIELCATAVSCQRLLDRLLALASPHQLAQLQKQFGAKSLRKATAVVGKELAARHRQSGAKPVIHHKRTVHKQGSPPKVVPPKAPPSQTTTPKASTPPLASVPPAATVAAPPPAPTPPTTTQPPTEHGEGHKPEVPRPTSRPKASLCVETPILPIRIELSLTEESSCQDNQQ